MADYVTGAPHSDNSENDSALFMDIQEALVSHNVVSTTKEILKAVLNNKDHFQKSDFIYENYDETQWQLFC